MTLEVVILAAGQGSRMKSGLPKVMHRLAGRPLLEHVVAAATALPHERVVVVHGHRGEQLREACAHLDVQWVEQQQQLGTGHAVRTALPVIHPDATVLVLYGDVPLITDDTLARLVAGVAWDRIALLTARLPDPAGYGRIVRDAGGAVVRIVEHRDASPEERAIDEVNTGVMAAPARRLAAWLASLGTDNAQGEYYLTDVIAMAARDGVTVHTEQPAALIEVQGVNTRGQLAALEREFQRLQAEYLMAQGVSLADPLRFDLRGSLTTGCDVTIDVDVVIEGDNHFDDGVSIGAFCHLRNVRLGPGAVVLPHSVLEDAVVGAGARIGPFARLRPGTELAEAVHVGNFVEVKKSRIGVGSKVNHLSYVGDADIGRDCNIGAGTITCNYDGANKHRTVIGDDVFVGSDVQLVAPVTVGSGATIGAGTTVTHDAPPEELTVGRVRQRSVPGWKRPRKPPHH